LTISKRRYLLILFFLSVAGCCLLVFCPDALALEKVSQGRKLWDLIMRLLNFGVIVFFILRYGRKPLMNFLRRYSKTIKDEIEGLQGKRGEMISKMEEVNSRLSDVDARTQELKGRIIGLGKKEKEWIIHQAQQRADLMIEDAKLMAEQEIVKAKQTLQAETVDSAISLAEKTLRGKLTSEDNQMIINQFILQIQKSSQAH